MENEIELGNTGVFKAIGKPHLPPGPLMVAEAACSAHMLEQDRQIGRGVPTTCIETAYGTDTRLSFQIKVF